MGNTHQGPWDNLEEEEEANTGEVAYGFFIGGVALEGGFQGIHNVDGVCIHSERIGILLLVGSKFPTQPKFDIPSQLCQGWLAPTAANI